MILSAFLLLLLLGCSETGERGALAGEASKTGALASACKDYDNGINSKTASYIATEGSMKGTKKFYADKCKNSDILQEQTCKKNGAAEIKEADCTKLKMKCLYNTAGLAYCGKPVTLLKPQKVDQAQKLVTVLNQAFQDTETKFGPIRTLEKLDETEQYPVDFVEEELFQHYLSFFLAGKYEEANIIHQRIAYGLRGSSQETVRKIDWALASYYTTLLTDTNLKNSQRAGIRGTVAPSITVIELIQYTGISNIRRVMDLYDGGPTNRKPSTTPTGHPVAQITTSPFLSATSSWPEEIGVSCFNFGSGTFDTFSRRPSLSINSSSGLMSIRRTRLASDNIMRGMVEVLTDETMLGLQDCGCLELIQNDFTCPNDLLCRTGGQDASLDDNKDTGFFIDPTTPSAEIVSTIDEVLANPCDINSIRSGAEGLGDISPWSRWGQCAAAVLAESPQGEELAHFECARNAFEEYKVGMALQNQYNIVDLGCSSGSETPGGGPDPSPPPEPKEDTSGGSSTEEEEPTTRECDDQTPDAAENTECDNLADDATGGHNNWEENVEERAECIRSACQENGCTTESVTNTINSVLQGVRDWVTSQPGRSFFNSVDRISDNPTSVNFNVLTETGSQQYHGGANGIANTATNTISILYGNQGESTAEHEIGHIILNELGITWNTESQNHHVIMENCDIATPESGASDYGNDVITSFQSQSCTAADQLFNDLFTCLPSSVTGEIPFQDPLAPYIQPNPDDPGSLEGGRLQPFLACTSAIFEGGGVLPEFLLLSPSARITSSNPGPDCNFLDVECCEVDNFGTCLFGGGLTQTVPLGCGSEETPIDPEQCYQQLCGEGEIPVFIDRGIECRSEPPGGGECGSGPCPE